MNYFVPLHANLKNHQNMILDKIDELLKEVQELSAKNAEEVEQLRLKYLSKKGEITALMNDFRNVAADQKKTVGMKINELKTLATERINQLREACETQETGEEAIDLTRTPYPIQLGTRHPLTIVTNEIIDIFSRMGFVLADGPEVEDDNHIFTKMNFAADHPARDMQDTFFVSQHPNDVTKNILLRSHTSSVQARVMERLHTEDGKLSEPIRVICPGRVYRNEAITARAHCFFHQVEGLYIDKNVSFTDLKQVLLSFAKEMFGPDTKIRLRPSYFRSRNPQQRWISPVLSAVARAAASASTPAGWRFSAAVWSTPTCSSSVASTPRSTRATPSAWASSASPT